MKHTSALLFAGLLTAGSAVAQVDLSKLPPPSPQKGVTYDKDIKPLFEASCVRCHSGDRARNNLHLDSLEGAIKGSRDHKVISPGDSEKSPLVIAIAQLNPRSAMPPPPRQPRRGGAAGSTNSAPPPPMSPDGGTNQPGGGRRGPAGPPPKPLTPAQVGLVRAWIDQGAK